MQDSGLLLQYKKLCCRREAARLCMSVVSFNSTLPRAQSFYCRLKAYNINCCHFLDSFRNKSGKPQPIRTKVRTHAQVKVRQRSWNFGRDRLSGGEMGAQKCPRRRFFVGNMRWLFGNFTTADFCQIWQRHVNRGWNADFGQKVMKSFHSGVIRPKPPNFEGVKQVPDSEQATGQGMHCREILQRYIVYSTL